MSSAPRTVAVIHGLVPPGAPADELDVLVEAQQVCGALESLGYRAVTVDVTLDLQSMLARLDQLAPCAVFNLVESLDGRDTLQHLAPAVLEEYGFAFTGSGADAIRLTSDKIQAKKVLSHHSIATPAWQKGDEVLAQGPAFPGPYFVKLAGEDASRGISDDSVKSDPDSVIRFLEPMGVAAAGRYIVEQFIEGREFNVSVLESGQGPVVLAPAEMQFVDYPPGKPAIVSFDAKWNPESFEYHNTVRRFEFGPQDRSLLAKLEQVSLACWDCLGLRGYARVDFRVDRHGGPYVLEANANPCIASDAGLAAAADRSGIVYQALIQRVIESALVAGRPSGTREGNEVL